MKGQSKRRLLIGLAVTLFLSCTLYFTTGLFIIQPIGAVPEGATIWYWRVNTNLPFISSADGLLLDRVGEVTLIGRVMALGMASNTIGDKKIITFPYSKTLYLISTGGKEFDK